MRIRRTRADDLFSRYIRARDKFCQKCGKSGRLEAAHIFSRRHWSTRHDPENAIALCHFCHRWFTENPVDFTEWCEDRMGVEAMAALRKRAHTIGKKAKGDEEYRAMALKEMVARQEAIQ